MKKILYGGLLLLLIQNSFAQSQNQFKCQVEVAPGMTDEEAKRATFRNIERPKNRSTNEPNTQKTLRIKFWLVTDQAGQVAGGEVSENTVRRQVQHLNQLYKPHNICFELAGIEKFIAPDLLYSNSLYGFVQAGSVLGADGNKIAFDDNSLNVYVNGLDWNTYQWYGISTHNQNYLAVRSYNMNSTTAMVLAHEIGHSLNLIHTHGAHNMPTGNPPLSSHERVTRDPNDPNYNAIFSGDFVRDTDADPGFISNILSPLYNYSADCKYIGNAVDYVGTPYTFSSDLAERNLMSYGLDTCLDSFSELQAERMHIAIETVAKLNNCLVDSNFEQDLIIRNSEQDFGLTPDSISPELWVSPDIWVRNNPDGNLEHQNPIYDNNINYVYVRVINKGCNATSGNDKIQLNWSKAGTSLPLTVWDGEIDYNGYPMGGIIGEQTIPVLESNEEAIISFEWITPNPLNYSQDGDQWHFCLLGQIISSVEQETLPVYDGNEILYRNTNNKALKNVSIINNSANETNSSIFVGNFSETSKNIKLSIKDLANNFSESIFKTAEVYLVLDDNLTNSWENSGSGGDNIKRVSSNVILLEPTSSIYFNDFEPNYFGKATIKVNFLTQVESEYDQFKFHIIHSDTDTNKLIGGELFQVNKKNRDKFKSLISKTSNTLNANIISESAIYKWYDIDGNLLHIGENYQIQNQTNEYTLETISLIDGFKDYDSISVDETHEFINSIVPNPVTDIVNINLNNINCSNSYIMIVNVVNGNSSNYILNGNTSISIDMSNFSKGNYFVVLVCDNEFIDSKQIIKN